MSSGTEYTKKTIQKHKLRAVRAMGGACQICGYNKCIGALEFHHLDESQKDFNISAGGSFSWEKINSEIKKTILVCANCHREIHAGLIETENLVSSYNEEIANQITQEIYDQKHHKAKYCTNCGKELPRRSRSKGLCQDCFKILRVENINNYNDSEIKKVKPNRDELKDLIRTKPFAQIARQFGVTDNAIRKWCKKENLPFRVTDIKLYTDDEWLKV